MPGLRAFDQFVVSVVLQHYLQVRQILLTSTQQRGNERVRKGIRRPQPEPTLLALCDTTRTHHGRLLRLQNYFNFGGECLPRGRELDSPRGSDQQRHPQGLLQPADRLAQRRLADVQTIGRPPKMLLLGKNTELLQYPRA